MPKMTVKTHQVNSDGRIISQEALETLVGYQTLKVQHNDGEMVWMDAEIVPDFDSDGRIVSMSLVYNAFDGDVNSR